MAPVRVPIAAGDNYASEAALAEAHPRSAERPAPMGRARR